MGGEERKCRKAKLGWTLGKLIFFCGANMVLDISRILAPEGEGDLGVRVQTGRDTADAACTQREGTKTRRRKGDNKGIEVDRIGQKDHRSSMKLCAEFWHIRYLCTPIIT